jgi:hypothetical protein
MKARPVGRRDQVHSLYHWETSNPDGGKAMYVIMEWIGKGTSNFRGWIQPYCPFDTSSKAPRCTFLLSLFSYLPNPKCHFISLSKGQNVPFQLRRSQPSNAASSLLVISSLSLWLLLWSPWGSAVLVDLVAASGIVRGFIIASSLSRSSQPQNAQP